MPLARLDHPVPHPCDSGGDRPKLAVALATLSSACTGATRGPTIPHYDARRTAVLVVDLQRDYLIDGAPLPIQRGAAPDVIAASNRVIDAARRAALDIVFIGNEFESSDWLANLWRHHATMRGTDGAKIDPRLHFQGDVYFDKQARDAFTNPALDAHLRARQVGRLVVVGVFADACVRATVLGARNRGYEVVLVSDGTAAGSPAARDDALDEMREAGASVASSEEVARGLLSASDGRPG